MRVLLVRQNGGSRGNSSRGQNRGNLYAPEKIEVLGVTTNIKCRHGSLLSYYIEYAEVEINETQFEDLQKTWDVLTEGQYILDDTAGVLQADGRWYIPWMTPRRGNY